jgi:pimeloyl-ACP methyl ester carboxylesterase
MKIHPIIFLTVIGCGYLTGLAAEPASRRIFPAGIAIPSAERAVLETGVAELGQQIEALRATLKTKPALLALLPDVQIYHKAVQWPLAYDELFRSNEVAIAKGLLKQGLERAAHLREGQAPWATATGLVVRGYVSKIDGSVQPYGLVVPASFQPGASQQHRLDLWLHGRDNNLTELKFIDGRQRSPGEFTPAHAFVLHLYGRYCNASKFAGETDTFEALEQVRRHYPIDDDRIAVRGFSMGGASCWHLATHHAGLWAAAAPGAGFAEAAEYLRISLTANSPPWYEQKLWHLYNATDYAANLFNCPTVAYSGEVDAQKTTADLMAKVLKGEGIELTHIIGPKTGHSYHPEAKKEVIRRVDSIVALGRNPVPSKVHFTTWTLRYNQMLWVTLDGLERHWERSRAEAEILNTSTVTVKTENVTALTLSMPSGLCPLENLRRPKVRIDGHELEAAPVRSDRSWVAHFRKSAGQWAVGDVDDDGGLRKRHGLQGPIDDAFLDSFIFVRPTGKPLNDQVEAWVNAELKSAMEAWREQFRGEVRIKDDAEITDADIATNHLILWGDPTSNQLLQKMAAKLPLEWSAQGLKLGQATYSAAQYLPVLIYPNPLNPKRYVVLNSGFTFHHPKASSNADQTPKLPDYAVVDLKAPRSVAVAGGVVAAGFFGEKWELPAEAANQSRKF